MARLCGEDDDDAQASGHDQAMPHQRGVKRPAQQPKPDPRAQDAKLNARPPFPSAAKRDASNTPARKPLLPNVPAAKPLAASNFVTRQQPPARRKPQTPSVSHSTVVANVFAPDATFTSLGLSPSLARHLEEGMGMARPTATQQAAIPAMLSGRDVLLNADTGTGKTLAYVAPIIHDLITRGTDPGVTSASCIKANNSSAIPPAAISNNSATPPARIDRTQGTYALIVAPTRELCAQIEDVLTRVTRRFVYLVPGSVMGGENRSKEKARLRKGVTLLVGTPGRLLDHLRNTASLRTDRVRWLVLDEADRLLDMGFEKDVREIISILDGAAASASGGGAGHQGGGSLGHRDGDDDDAGDYDEDLYNNGGYDDDDRYGGSDRRGSKVAGVTGAHNNNKSNQNNKAGTMYKRGTTKSLASQSLTSSPRPRRQNVLVSATLHLAVSRLAKMALRDPVRASVADTSAALAVSSTAARAAPQAPAATLASKGDAGALATSKAATTAAGAGAGSDGHVAEPAVQGAKGAKGADGQAGGVAAAAAAGASVKVGAQGEGRSSGSKQAAEGVDDDSDFDFSEDSGVNEAGGGDGDDDVSKDDGADFVERDRDDDGEEEGGDDGSGDSADDGSGMRAGKRQRGSRTGGEEEDDGDGDEGQVGTEGYGIPCQLRQRYLQVPSKLQLAALAALLRGRSVADAGFKAVVFVSSCDACEFLHAVLGAATLPPGRTNDGYVGVLAEANAGEGERGRSEGKGAKDGAGGKDRGGKGKVVGKKGRGRGVGEEGDSSGREDAEASLSSDDEEGDDGGNNEDDGGRDEGDPSGRDRAYGKKRKVAAMSKGSATANNVPAPGKERGWGHDREGQKSEEGAKSGGKDATVLKPSAPLHLRTNALIPIPLFKLHGNLGQSDRMRCFRAFGSASRGVLICTDVGSRGLDFPRVRMIIQYDPPGEPEEYVHRVGRTARLGSAGESVLFLAPEERPYLGVLARHGVGLEPMLASGVLDHIADVVYDKRAARRGLLASARDPFSDRSRQGKGKDGKSRGARGGNGHGWGQGDDDDDDDDEGGEDDDRAMEALHHHPVASELLFRFQKLVEEEQPSLRPLAVDAFRSFVRSYAVHRGDLKRIFHVKRLHLGHVAAAYALSEAPSLVGQSSTKLALQKARKERAERHLRKKRRIRPGREGR
eukprot:jgi/Mesvir1/16962/Mv15810-RA.1